MTEMKMMFSIPVLMLMGLVCCQPKEVNQLTEQEYAVYLAVIGERPKNFIVVDETTLDAFGEISSGKLPEIIPGILAETSDDYVQKNQKPPSIAENFPFEEGYRVIPRSEREKLIPEFDRHYVVSRVGFSKDGKQAFVRFYDNCSALCGDGAFYLLTNVSGRWEISTESEHWKT